MLANARTHAFGFVCAVLASRAPAAQTPPVFTDTGVAVAPNQIGDNASIVLGPNAVVTNVPESSHESDRNGDGDLLDVVPLVTLVRDGSARNLGAALAVGLPVRISARFVTFFVDEAGDGGRDHNADGDALDRVLFVHDLVLATTASTGITLPATYALGARYLATLESEATLGLGDVNGDGFVAQTIVLRDLVSGSTTYTGALPISVHSGAGRILWQSLELGVGDLNGEGDTNDRFLTSLVEVSGVRFALPIEGNPGSPIRPFQVDEDFVACGVSESDFGPRDLNGDGDALDELTALILRGVERPAFVDVNYIDAVGTGGVVAFAVREGSTVDLNGDGDTIDYALQVYDARRRTLTNLPFAVRYHTVRGFNVTVDRGLVAFTVHESWQGQTDLNSDGDAVDEVAHGYDTTTGITLSSGLATWGLDEAGGLTSLRVSAGRIAFPAALPGSSVSIAHAWRPFGSAPALVNLGPAAEGTYPFAYGLERDLFAMCARERVVDANGDGDVLDIVVRVHDLSNGSIVETGLVVIDPMGPPLFVVGDGYVVFAAHEITSLGGDRNGDFDVQDDVPVVVRLRN